MTAGSSSSIAFTDGEVPVELRSVAKEIRDKSYEQQVWYIYLLKSHLDEQRNHVEQQGQDLIKLQNIIDTVTDPAAKEMLQRFYQRKKQHLANQRRDIIRMTENTSKMEAAVELKNAGFNDVVDKLFKPR